MKSLSFSVLRHLHKTLLVTLLLTTNITLAVADPQAILIYGDSLSAGYGLQRGEEWPVLVQQSLEQKQLPYKVINASVSGETTQGGLLRFAKTFDKHQPSIVLLELGANDGLRGQSLKKMHANLTSMIRYSLENNAQVLLAGIHIPPNYGQRYSASFYKVFKRLESEHNITFIPFLLEGVGTEDKYKQKDGLHPNAAAQPIISTTVMKSLIPLLQKP